MDSVFQQLLKAQAAQHSRCRTRSGWWLLATPEDSYVILRLVHYIQGFMGVLSSQTKVRFWIFVLRSSCCHLYWPHPISSPSNGIFWKLLKGEVLLICWNRILKTANRNRNQFQSTLWPVPSLSDLFSTNSAIILCFVDQDQLGLLQRVVIYGCPRCFRFPVEVADWNAWS